MDDFIGKGASLTKAEKYIVKYLINERWRNQDILSIVNIGRENTVNPARIAEVKGDSSISPAAKEDVEKYILIQKSWDLKRKLNPYLHERIYKSIEAMQTAVNIFNSHYVRFKAELFSILSVISWTYILHEYFLRKGVGIKKGNRYIALHKMIKKRECPLSRAERKNIEDIIRIRDAVEHKLLGDADRLWASLFQANCLNYNKFLKKNFWKEISIDDTGYALQFSGFEKSQIEMLSDFGVPKYIKDIDREMINDAKNYSIDMDYNYRMRLVVMYQAAGEEHSAVKFIAPESEEGKEITKVLIKERIADEKYPYKPKAVCDIVSKKIGRKFSLNEHTNAWKKYKVRPSVGSRNPERTDRKFCIYHPAHRDYTYSDEWIEFLVKEYKKVGDS